MVDKLTDDNVDDGCKLVSKLIIKKHRISYHEIYNEIQSSIQGGKEEEGEDEEENGRKRMKIIDDSNKNEMDISKSNDKSNDYMYTIIDQLILKSIDVGYLPENGIEIDQENNMIYLLPSSYLHLKNNSFFKSQHIPTANTSESKFDSLNSISETLGQWEANIQASLDILKSKIQS